MQRQSTIISTSISTNDFNKHIQNLNSAELETYTAWVSIDIVQLSTIHCQDKDKSTCFRKF